MGTTSKLGTAGKVAVPSIALAAILIKIFGPTINGQSTNTLAGIVALVFSTLAGVIHAPAVKRAAHKARRVTRRRKPRRPPAPRFISVFDSTNMHSLARVASSSADLIGAYDDGLYNNVADARRDFPGHVILTFCVNPDDAGDFLDNEPGNAGGGTPQERAARSVDWFEAHYRHATITGLYCDGSDWAFVDAELSRRGYSVKPAREGGPLVRLIADPTGHPHIPDGYDGCQWGWFGSYDESLFYAQSLRAVLG